jgi:hypothetical protein
MRLWTENLTEIGRFEYLIVVPQIIFSLGTGGEKELRPDALNRSPTVAEGA